jgi:hypothetical protein
MVFWSELSHGRQHLQKRLLETFLAERPHDIDPLLDVRGRADAIFGATSPDGLHWNLIEEPFLLHMADNPNTAYYDTLLRKYVLFTRASWMYGRRCIGRAESDTFGPFSQPQMIVWPDLTRLPSDDLYTNAKCLYPGTADQHFLFPAVYHRATDNCSIEMMSSPDSIHWFRLPGNPVVQGDPETGMTDVSSRTAASFRSPMAPSAFPAGEAHSRTSTRGGPHETIGASSGMPYGRGSGSHASRPWERAPSPHRCCASRGEDCG